MFLKVCWGLIVLFLMVGCSTPDVPDPPDGHPANAESNAANPPDPSSTLYIEKPVERPDETPAMRHDMEESHDTEHENGGAQ